MVAADFLPPMMGQDVLVRCVVMVLNYERAR
jgi:hypothetical protein